MLNITFEPRGQKALMPSSPGRIPAVTGKHILPVRIKRAEAYAVTGGNTEFITRPFTDGFFMWNRGTVICRRTVQKRGKDEKKLEILDFTVDDVLFDRLCRRKRRGRCGE